MPNKSLIVNAGLLIALRVDTREPTVFPTTNRTRGTPLATERQPAFLQGHDQAETGASAS